MDLMPPNYTLKMVKMGHFMLHIIYFTSKQNITTVLYLEQKFGSPTSAQRPSLSNSVIFEGNQGASALRSCTLDLGRDVLFLTP